MPCRRAMLGAALSIFLSATVAAETVTLPASARKATQDEFIAFVDGKSVEVTIYDMDKPVTAVLTWRWKKKAITGTAVIDGKDKIKVRTKWSFKGDKACSDKECHDIYIDGNSFYEVREDGVVHALSVVK
jgi:hypothetical protein